MSKSRDIANILSASTAMATDAEVSSAVSTHISATDPHGDRADTTTKIATHASATDPHGDRTDAATLYATKTNFPADAWTAYTPTISSDTGTFSIGNGSITGRYKQLGKTVFFYIKLVYGSTSTPGNGHWKFGLPVTAYNTNYQFSASILDNGVSWYGGIGNGNYIGSTTSFAVITPSPTSTSTGWVPVGNGGPFTWGDADNITISGSYEAA